VKGGPSRASPPDPFTTGSPGGNVRSRPSGASAAASAPRPGLQPARRRARRGPGGPAALPPPGAGRGPGRVADLFRVLAGQTVPEFRPGYDRLYGAARSDLVRSGRAAGQSRATGR